jgi:hypothetical protein
MDVGIWLNDSGSYQLACSDVSPDLVDDATVIVAVRASRGRTDGSVPLVIFHCSSSNGRGPRCAGWYQDALVSQGVEGSEAVILAGGVKAWEKDFPGDVISI